MHANQPAKLPSLVLDWENLPVTPTAAGERRELFDAPSATFDRLEGHVTTLRPGQSPHPPHRHPDEEMVVVKSGIVDVMINGHTTRVGAGSVCLFASQDLHGLRNTGPEPTTYFVLRFVTPLTPTA